MENVIYYATKGMGEKKREYLGFIRGREIFERFFVATVFHWIPSKMKLILRLFLSPFRLYLGTFYDFMNRCSYF